MVRLSRASEGNFHSSPQVLHTHLWKVRTVMLKYFFWRLICAFLHCAIQIKPADVIAAKYATRGAAAGQDYAAGVAAPRTDWAQATEASTNAWGAGVQQAVSAGSFGKGVARAGTAKWQRKAAGVGATRYGPGVQAAKQDYATGVAPYLQVLSNLTLPPRGPKGDPGNINRVATIATALRTKKMQG